MTAFLTALTPLLLMAVTWHPAADWVERPDPLASPRARKGGTIRFNGAQPPKSFNAYVDNNTYSSMVFDLLYEKLLSMDARTTDAVPALARRWCVSEDGREFTFALDERARWSDGVPVTAEDVKWTFDTVMDPKSETGPWKPTLGFFESPEIVDARTVRFRKKGDSTRDWRDILNCSTFWILPKHAFAGQDFNKIDFLGAVVGGPYQIVRAEEQIETELRRHGHWWRQDLPNCRGLANFDRILVRYFAENENAFEALKAGKIDVYPVYTARIYAQETGGEKFRRNWILRRRVKNHAPVGFQGFAMNMRRKPFDNLKVRQAMAKLLDRETMNRTMMNGAYFLLNSYFHDIYDSAHPCTNVLWRYDVAGAKRLLAEAGYAKGFRFSFLSRSATEDKFLALFSHALKECGVTMDIVRKDFASWMRDMDEFNYDMTWASWGASVIKTPEIMWAGREADRKGSNNITGFKNTEVDRLIECEKGFDNAADRLAAYKRIDALIAAEVPYVLLWHTDETRLIYWNKFGMPEAILSKFGHEDDILSYWWYDSDRAAELTESMRANSFLPAVPEQISFDMWYNLNCHD